MQLSSSICSVKSWRQGSKSQGLRPASATWLLIWIVGLLCSVGVVRFLRSRYDEILWPKTQRPPPVAPRWAATTASMTTRCPTTDVSQPPWSSPARRCAVLFQLRLFFLGAALIRSDAVVFSFQRCACLWKASFSDAIGPDSATARAPPEVLLSVVFSAHFRGALRV